MSSRDNYGSPSRRDMLRLAGLGLVGGSVCGWLPELAAGIATHPKRRRHCVLLWMAGGPSQTDTFDMKPHHSNGGEFQEIPTSVPGVRFSEHLPQLAAQADKLAIVRSLRTKEGDHDRGTHLVRTGHPPGTDVRYPSIACCLSKQLANKRLSLPGYVSVSQAPIFSPAAFGPGFLGPQYAPALVGGRSGDAPQTSANADGGSNAELRLEHLQVPAGVNGDQARRRLELWESLQSGFLASRRAPLFVAHNTLYRQALAMMGGGAREVFDLNQEPEDVRTAYGPGRFGQGCLLARRLIEHGVPFVEVVLGDGAAWDTHQDNFRQVQTLSEQLDAGWATLMRELDDRGLLESTTILWMGEFGRTPVINPQAGRDHFPNAWSCVLAGGGVAGGQTYGQTSASGRRITDGEVGIGDILATLCEALGVDPSHEEPTESGRPIRIAEGTPIREILA